MFTHLVESESHLEDLKRRGIFVFGTLIFYALLFAVGGVFSIYAYNAHMESQSLELQTFLPPVELRPVAPAAPDETSRPATRSNDDTVDTRRELFADVDRPNLAPPDVSSRPPTSPPVRAGIPTVLGPANSNAADIGGPIGPAGPSTGARVNTPAVIDVEAGTPPPARVNPTPPPPQRPVSLGPITGKAISLPKPPYPPSAKAIGAQGAVTVQIVVDETGKVLSARAVSGHFMLRQAAEQSAYQARFKPTTLNGQAVKVSGTITFNFILDH
jgi:periplasmic protein TonB